MLRSVYSRTPMFVGLNVFYANNRQSYHYLILIPSALASCIIVVSPLPHSVSHTRLLIFPVSHYVSSPSLLMFHHSTEAFDHASIPFLDTRVSLVLRFSSILPHCVLASCVSLPFHPMPFSSFVPGLLDMVTTCTYL